MLNNRANSLKPICKIDVTAFASLMVFLVALVMVATPSPHHGVGVDFPKVWHPIGMWRANGEDALIIVPGWPQISQILTDSSSAARMRWRMASSRWFA